MEKLDIKNLYLIFGSAKQHAMKMLKSGKSKKEIHSRTKCTIAVNDASLSIKRGEIFVIIGLSGSGKSSLLRCLNMLNVPTSGSIYIDGVDITKMSKKELLELRRKQVAMVFQSFGLLPHRTILANVAFGLEIQGVPLEERLKKAEETINLVGLSGYENSYPHQLSGGMQQRVGIARALTTDSEILLMDEAFSALDPLIRAQMQDELLEIQQKLQKTIIFITHDLDEALKLGNTIAIMKDGVIVQQGQPEEILINPADEYVEAFVNNVDKTKIITASSIMEPFRSKMILGKDGPVFTLRQMQKHVYKFLPVTDNSNKFLGYITERDVKKLIEEKQSDLSSKLKTDIPKVHEDCPIADLLPLYLNQRFPLTVVDHKERPVGYIQHSDVVAAITGYDDDEVQTIIENANESFN